MREWQWRFLEIQGIAECYSKKEYSVIGTLNFKGGISKEDAEKAAQHFWNRIDVLAFGKKAVKAGNMRLERVCMLDGGRLDEKEKRNHEYINKFQTIKNIQPIDITNIRVSHIETGHASFNNANLHFHFSCKLGGQFNDASELAAVMRDMWDGFREAGKHSKIEKFDTKRGIGWHAYMASKFMDGMEHQKTSFIESLV